MSLFLFILTAATLFCCSTLADEYHWVDTPGKYMELLYGERPVLRYVYAPLDETSEQSRFETYKVFHHLYDPTGKFLITNGPTGDAPYSKDVLYPHHRGLFYGFSDITYGEGKEADTWHCKNGESQQHVAVLESGGGEFEGWHRVAIHWHDADGKVFAKEEREVTARFFDGAMVVDFVSQLESATGGPIHLDGDPQHAGFQFRATDRVAKETKDTTYYLRTDGKGKLGETRNWNYENLDAPQNEECTNRPWNALSFVVDEKRYSVLYMDHLSNPKPARYSERDYGRFGSFFAHEILPDKPLVVRYRLRFQEGEIDVKNGNMYTSRFQSFCGTRLNPYSPFIHYKGFTTVFNGTDLSNWKGLVGNPKTRAAMSAEELATAQAKADENMKKHWKAEEGALVFDGKGENICTAKDYGNFEMYVTWKIEEEGDSGIYIRGCPQVQIWDTANKETHKHGADKGSGALWNNKSHERHPLVKADNPVGEWNTFYIKMIDDRVTVKLNGKLVTDNVVMENYWERDKPLYATGQIELQSHGSKLWFKNIYMRELP